MSPDDLLALALAGTLLFAASYGLLSALATLFSVLDWFARPSVSRQGEAPPCRQASAPGASGGVFPVSRCPWCGRDGPGFADTCPPSDYCAHDSYDSAAACTLPDANPAEVRGGLYGSAESAASRDLSAPSTGHDARR